jgi:serine/threonine protein kinase
MAPEVLKGHTPDPKADIFSLGVVIWEMVTGGQFPWHDKSSLQIRELVSRLKLRLHIPRASRELYPKELLEVLDSRWTHDGRDRPHAQVVAQRLQERRGGTESQSERERILQILRIPAPISPEDLYTASIDRLCL